MLFIEQGLAQREYLPARGKMSVQFTPTILVSRALIYHWPVPLAEGYFFMFSNIFFLFYLRITIYQNSSFFLRMKLKFRNYKNLRPFFITKSTQMLLSKLKYIDMIIIYISVKPC